MLIVGASRNVLFNTMEDVFVTGICRAVAAVPCTCMPGIPRISEVTTDCEVASGRVNNLHYIQKMDQMKRLWLLVNNQTARTVCIGKSLLLSDFIGIWQVGGLGLVAIVCCRYFVQKKRLNMRF